MGKEVKATRNFEHQIFSDIIVAFDSSGSKTTTTPFHRQDYDLGRLSAIGPISVLCWVQDLTQRKNFKLYYWLPIQELMHRWKGDEVYAATLPYFEDGLAREFIPDWLPIPELKCLTKGDEAYAASYPYLDDGQAREFMAKGCTFLIKMNGDTIGRRRYHRSIENQDSEKSSSTDRISSLLN